MADGRDPTPPYTPDTRFRWTEIFRCFQIAIDPRKLLVAAAGILAMSLLWWLLSRAFYYDPPKPTDDRYSAATVQKDFLDRTDPATGQTYTGKGMEDAVAAEAGKRYNRDLAEWRQLDALAGPGGRLRTLPWDEYRGPNPFLFGTDVLGGTAADRANAITGFLSGSVPVLVEPLVKLLLPVAKLFSPGVNSWTRVYLFFILLANVAVWAFAGGIITRIAAVQLANKGPVSLGQAYRFVRNRYLSYLGAPLVPLVIIAVCVLGLMVYGFFGLIPFVGDLVVLGLGLPVVIIGGAVMAVFLVGLVGYPLMYPTLSAEGDQSDTFDALSRSVNYVYQSPWQYLWAWLVAILYGAACTLFVVFFTCMAVYVGKWAVGLTASLVWTDRKPEYLFIHAPESFGWRELLTRNSPYAVRGQWVLLKDGKEFADPADAIRTANLDKLGKETTDAAQATRTASFDRDGREVMANPAEADRRVFRTAPVDPAAYNQARSEFYAYNSWAAWIVWFWLTLLFLMMLGFSYSFFWTAATIIYLLLRKKLDEAELDEVFIEDDEPEVPPAPPKIAEGTGSLGTSLPVITPPTIPPVPPAPVSPPPLPPVVMSPPVSPPPPPPAVMSPPPVSPPPYSFLSPPPPESPRRPEEPKPKDEPKPDDDAPLG